MRETQFIAISAIVCHQQPARQTLFDLAAPVGKRRLCDLHHESMRVMQQHVMQGDARANGLA